MLLKFLDGLHAMWPFPRMSASFLFYPILSMYIKHYIQVFMD